MAENPTPAPAHPPRQAKAPKRKKRANLRKAKIKAVPAHRIKRTLTGS